MPLAGAFRSFLTTEYTEYTERVIFFMLSGVVILRNEGSAFSSTADPSFLRMTIPDRMTFP
jgi:hypothetical protein